MAEIVLGIGTSHSPHLSTPFEQWDLHVERDHANRHLHFRGGVYTYDELVSVRESEGIAERELERNAGARSTRPVSARSAPWARRWPTWRPTSS